MLLINCIVIYQEVFLNNEQVTEHMLEFVMNKLQQSKHIFSTTWRGFKTYTTEFQNYKTGHFYFQKKKL